jgi:hypothetical protein
MSTTAKTRSGRVEAAMLWRDLGETELKKNSDAKQFFFSGVAKIANYDYL